jgi:hypothetical protein
VRYVALQVQAIGMHTIDIASTACKVIDADARFKSHLIMSC